MDSCDGSVGKDKDDAARERYARVRASHPACGDCGKPASDVLVELYAIESIAEFATVCDACGVRSGGRIAHLPGTD